MKKIAALLLMLSVVSSLGTRLALAEDAAIGSRLRAIEEKQTRILQALEELKSELQIVKIRITSR